MSGTQLACERFALLGELGSSASDIDTMQVRDPAALLEVLDT